jgi:hypothetical protein
MLSALVHTLRQCARPALATEVVRLVIVTKNSSAWIGEMLDAYAQLGISPKVLLDAFSTDETEKVLSRRRADYDKIWPEHPRVEAAVRLIGDYVESPWIFRVDDDELPSRALLHWIGHNLENVDCDVVGVPRRWLRLSQRGYCEYSNHPLLSYHETAMDAQWRLFRPRKLDYTTEIHTPGFIVGSALVAPNTAYLAHFDWIIRSRNSRLSKVMNYDLQAEGAGSFFRDLYVWEDSDSHSHGFRRLETREFDRIGKRLQRVRS